jgi:hypothetical protein
MSLEGDARKVSRRAASIVLHADGAFSLLCLGRRLVSVLLQAPYTCSIQADTASGQRCRSRHNAMRCNVIYQPSQLVSSLVQVRVNGREILPGSSAPLPHLSLLEAGRVRLLFAVNPGAVRRIVRRSRAITLEA